MMFVDGEPADCVPANDRGLAYGDGVFETLRARGSTLPLLDWHLERLQRGLAALRIAQPPEGPLRDELLQVAAATPGGIIKLTVTRGSGGRGYRAPVNAVPRRIVQSAAVPAHVERWQREGVSLRVCETRLAGPAALAGLKHLNRLPQVLARAEWQDEFDEGLMRNADGGLVEGTMSNVFVVHGDTLLTPPVGPGVAGVMRRLVISLAAASRLAVREETLPDAAFETADEIFITNSVIGVCPVRRFETRELPVGTIARRLQSAIDKELERRA